MSRDSRVSCVLGTASRQTALFGMKSHEKGGVGRFMGTEDGAGPVAF